jgi:hypothetical protein
MQRATRAEWVERVERWRQSQLTAAEFAQREGIRAEVLRWWGPGSGASSEEPPLDSSR